MVLLDVSIVNVALPSIARGLGADDSDLQWVVSGYALAFGLVLVAGGRIGDARGRRPTLMIGLAVFTLASAACGLARSAVMLIIARLVQGVGGGLVTPQNAGLIQHLFRGAERGRAFGLFGAVVGVSTAIGPAARRAAHPVRRGAGGLAVDLLRQPAGRHRGDDPGRTDRAAPAAGEG